MARAPRKSAAAKAPPASAPAVPANEQPASSAEGAAPEAGQSPTSTAAVGGEEAFQDGAATAAPDAEEERRRFAVTMDVWHDGELFTENGDAQPLLTHSQFTRLKAGQAVAGEWDEA